MIARDQIDRLFNKLMNQESDLQPFNLLVQLTHITPTAYVSDGVTKIELFQPNQVLRNLRNDSNSFLSANCLLNSMIILKDVEFLVAQDSKKTTPEVAVTAKDCSLIVPGIHLERWGNPSIFNVKTKPIFLHLIKNVSNLISY